MKQKQLKEKKSLFRGSTAAAMAGTVLFCALVLSVLLGVTFGTTDIPLRDVYGTIVEKLWHMITGDPNWGETRDALDPAFCDYLTENPLWKSGGVYRTVWYIRLPRVLLAMLIGMGLSICGVIMQAVVKNPLADPYVLGISSGASLGATAAIMLGIGAVFGSNFVGVMAFLGAFLVSLGVVGISNLGGRPNSTKLLLAGTALSAVCGSFSNFIVYFANDKEGMQSVTYWLMGSLAGAKWNLDGVMTLVVLGALVFFMTQYRSLNLMLLGDEVSITLGTNLHRRRQVYLLVSAAIVGFAVYSAGMIGFVGLIVPHVVRMLFGTDHKKMIPLSALVGAIFLVWADVACRILIKGQELPIGILTSMIGAPCFIYLMIRKRYGFGGGGS